MNKLANSESFIETFGLMADYIYTNNVDKGFWDTERNKGEMLMLVVSELAEALEYIRHGNPPSDHIPEFSGVEEELADAVIRLMDISTGLKLRLAEAIVAKVEFNKTRPRKHGKQF